MNQRIALTVLLAILAAGPGTVSAGINVGTSLGLEGEFISTLAIDPQTPSTVYAGTQHGVFKSTDGGTSWSAANSGLPAGSVGHGTNRGVLRSTDGGASWSAVSSWPATLNVETLAIDPQNSSTVYAGTNGGGVFAITFPPVLALDSTNYCIGGSWSLKVSNAASNAPIRLLGTTNGVPWEIAEWQKTDASGSFSAVGTLAPGTEGSYTLRVEIGGAPSNAVSFGVSDLCTPVDLNGTYLAPSGGGAGAVASATTHPLGDRRGEGQVYEASNGVRVPDGTYTPFSDDGKKPLPLSGADMRGKSFQCNVDLHDLSLWNDAGGDGAEFFQIGVGRQADPRDTRTEEVFVFIYRYGKGFALYMETDWALYRPPTTYYSAADETKFRVRVDVNTAGTEALLTVIPLNGVGAGAVHTVNPLPLDAGNDNVTSASFFAGFTQNVFNMNSTAKATISNFVTNAAP